MRKEQGFSCDPVRINSLLCVAEFKKKKSYFMGKRPQSIYLLWCLQCQGLIP